VKERRRKKKRKKGAINDGEKNKFFFDFRVPAKVTCLSLLLRGRHQTELDTLPSWIATQRHFSFLVHHLVVSFVVFIERSDDESDKEQQHETKNNNRHSTSTTNRVEETRRE
jgi:hypothetical protein